MGNSNFQSHGFVDSIVQLNKFPKEQYNVLTPVTSIQVMSNMQKILVNEVSLDTDFQNGGDIYLEKSSGKYAITKVGGTKLAAAANISVISIESITPDVCVRCIEMAKQVGKAQTCGSCPHAYDVKKAVKIRVPEPSGNFRIIEKCKEIDCEMEKKSMKTDLQFNRFLPHRASIAESKAFMRCLRDALGLKAGYTLDELKKPFIIAHIVPNLDAPEIRERFANGCLSSMGLLFEMPAEQKQLTTEQSSEVQECPALSPVDGNLNEADIQNLYDDPKEEELPCSEPPSDGIWCDDCGEEIVETVGRNGQKWTAKAIQSFSKNKFGRTLCPDCQKGAQ